MSQNTTAMQRGAGGETTGATDMTTRQPEALDLADWLIGVGGGPSAQRAAALLRSQHARITELEAQLEAVGAGGVGPLIAGAGFDAADMATAAAQGFRDGVASVSAGSEPVAEIGSAAGDCAAFGERALYPLVDIDRFDYGTMLYAHPSPPEGMAGRLQVYRCKIKSKKQIDKEIPREQQGWWADVAAGQKLLLRQAVQSDLDRCTLGGKRSRNPADYMCETENHGSLVSKVALEYMNPEQNVFAAAPGPADGESNV